MLRATNLNRFCSSLPRRAATTRMAVPAAATMAARSMSDSAKARALAQAKALMDQKADVAGWKAQDQGLSLSRGMHNTTAMGTAPEPAEGLNVCIDCYLSGGSINALRVHSGAESSTFEAEQQQRLRYSNDVARLVLLASAAKNHYSKVSRPAVDPARKGDKPGGLSA